MFLSSPIVNKVYFIFFSRVKIADLGIARKSESVVVTYAGTPAYMSPELFGGQGYAFPNDIWALGVIAYEMCTLKHPFLGCSPAATQNNILNTTPPPIPQFDPHSQFDTCYLYSGLIGTIYHFICDVLFHPLCLIKHPINTPPIYVLS